jgi:hypothetical protein
MHPQMFHATASLIARLLCLPLAGFCAAAQAQPAGRAIQGADVQKLANGILGVMSYTVAPDVTTSSLAITSSSTSSTHLTMSQFGGGFTWSKQRTLYLEGNAAWARYDPVFLASDGKNTRSVPAQWDSFSATVGVGWDFPLSAHWVVRPIFHYMRGAVVSDLMLAKWWLESNTPLDLNFLDGGRLKAEGLGGALMLDYERFTPEADDDIELRYTNVGLRSRGDSALGVQGRAKSESISLWARRRVPTGWGVVWGRPVRYVYEAATTRYLGNETDVGLTQMSSLGFGLELDSSARDVFVARLRAVARYKFGPNTRGWTVGLAATF